MRGRASGLVAVVLLLCGTALAGDSFNNYGPNEVENTEPVRNVAVTSSSSMVAIRIETERDGWTFALIEPVPVVRAGLGVGVYRTLDEAEGFQLFAGADLWFLEERGEKGRREGFFSPFVGLQSPPFLGNFALFLTAGPEVRTGEKVRIGVTLGLRRRNV